MPLVGLVVKVSSGNFLIGLSEADRQRKLQMLKELGWFDMPIHYSDGRRAILALQKLGPRVCQRLADTSVSCLAVAGHRSHTAPNRDASQDRIHSPDQVRSQVFADGSRVFQQSFGRK